MRRASAALAVLALTACSKQPSAPIPPAASADATTPTADTSTDSKASAPEPRTLEADTPTTTVAGNTFVAPARWTISVSGPATILAAPEGDSKLAIVDVQASDADAAVAKAWAAFAPAMKWKQIVRNEAPDRDGWTKITSYGYDVPPNAARRVGARAAFANGTWTIVLIDVSDATAERRGSQLGTVLGQLLPKGGAIESFAGKAAHRLDATRVAALTKFVADSQALLGVEGVGLGLVDHGEVVFAGGFGVRALGKPAKVDADTRFIVASNTKAFTTLMLAKLVEEKALTWETTATSLLPSFALGNAETTAKVQVKHLICACTGMPRQDLEWLFEYADLTPEGAMRALAGMQPTTAFGELFQYSNVMAAAAGFIGGHVAYPKLELGKAYDKAMRTKVFDPLGMNATTFDFKKAMTGNFAMPHGYDIDLKSAIWGREIDASIVPVRPAAGAWSTVNDMLAYVRMELAEGVLPNGKRYIAAEPLLARRAPQVAVAKDFTYGMGLLVDTRNGVTVVSHGGDVPGFHSDMLWIPEAGAGAVILTNSDRGIALRDAFRRKLLEVLYDGKPQAEAELAKGHENFLAAHATERALITVPADAEVVAALADRYSNPALGSLAVIRKGTTTVIDVGEWKSEIATRKHPDGSVSLVTISPGVDGFEFVVGSGANKTLVLRDAQHTYEFTAG